MSEVPVLVVNKLEIGEIKLCFYHFTQLIFYLSCPFAYKNNKFIYVPGNSSTRHHCVIAFKFCFQPLNVGTIVFFIPYFTVCFGIVDKRYSFVGRHLSYRRCQLHLVDSKEFHRFEVQPENSNTRHSAIGKFLHTIHYCVVLFLCSFSHNCAIIEIFLANV